MTNEERTHFCPFCGTENEVSDGDDSYICRATDCEEIVDCAEDDDDE